MAKTMCKIAKDLPKALPKYIELIIDSKFVCKKCGRTANNEIYICKSVEL